MINKQGDDSCGYIKRNVATMEACHQMSTREWPFQGPMGKATLAIIRQVGCNDVHLPINGGKTLRLAGKTRVDESPQDSTTFAYHATARAYRRQARRVSSSRLAWLRRTRHRALSPIAPFIAALEIAPFRPDGHSCGSETSVMLTRFS